MDGIVADVELIHLVGLVSLFAIGIISTTFLQQWATSKWRNGNGNRRDDQSQVWTVEMLRHLAAIDSNIVEINREIKNGLSSRIDEIHDTVNKCHELNLIKDHDLRNRE
jgi:hypothetical protein